MTGHVFITGLTGFVGLHLAERMQSDGWIVSGVSQSGRWPNHAPLDLRRSATLFAWDVAEDAPEEVVRHLAAAPPSAIVHLAALSVPADCGVDAPSETAWRTNVEGVERVVELADRCRAAASSCDIGSDAMRLLLASSAYVYRPVEAPGILVDEEWPEEPRGGYGRTKLEAERRLAERAGKLGVAWIVARAFQHTGPGQSPRMMLPEWAEQFARGGDGPIRVHTLDGHLDLTDVRDVVRAYAALLDRGEPNAVYNVGSGVCRRTGDIFDRLRSWYHPRRDVVETSPGMRCHPIADTRKIERDTGWRPEIPLDRTIRDTMQFWLTKGDS